MIPIRIGENAETGQTWFFDPRDVVNAVVGGRSGSGKSNFLYILAAIALSSPDMRFCTIDKDGALSAHLAPSPFRWSGYGLVTEGLDTLERIVAVMDSRLAQLRDEKRDKFEYFSVEFPLYFVIIDELAGLFARLKTYDLEQGLKGRESVENRARVLVSRLMAEGRKAGFCTVLATQKPTIAVFSEGIRENAGLAVSFANEPGAVRLLLPSVSAEACERLESQPSGTCRVRDMRGGFLAKADFLNHEIYKSIGEAGFIS